jgi:glycosyltransferase involved in cell wall biosynthesis
MKGKILFFIPDFSMGGAENMMINLANYGIQKKIPIIFVVLNKKGPLFSKLNENIRIHSLESNRMIIGIIKLYFFLIKEKPQIILSTLIQANLAALIVKVLGLKEIKVVIRVESIMSQLIKDKKNFSFSLVLMKRIFPYFYKRADKIVTVSNNVAKDLHNNFKVFNTFTLHNPAISKEFHNKINENLNEIWWPKNEKVVLSVGRLNPVKDFPTLIHAFSKANLTDTKLVILGEGESFQELKELIKELKMEKYIILPGFVDNPLKFIKNSDLFVLTSIYEGFSNALVQALACKIPIIATNCPGGNSEILNNGLYGDLFQPGDSDELSILMVNNLEYNKIKNIPDEWLKLFDHRKIHKEYFNLLQAIIK